MLLAQTVSFFDAFKKSIVEQFSTGATVGDMVLSLLVAFLMGAFILLIYKQTFRGVLYSKGFAFSLILLAMVTALVIRTISSNLALSLGMVGALSIVRFRTAIKDPVDTVFMFWAITCGIMAGAGIYLVGLCACFGVGFIYFLVSILYRKNKSPYLLIVRYDPEKTANIGKVLHQLPKHRVKSRTMTRTGAEITVEVALKDNEMETVDNFLSVDGVLDASLVSYEGEFGI